MLNRSFGIGRWRSIFLTMFSHNLEGLLAPGTLHAMPVITGHSSAMMMVMVTMIATDGGSGDNNSDDGDGTSNSNSKLID